MEKTAYTKGTTNLSNELLNMKQTKILKRTLITDVKCLTQCLVCKHYLVNTLFYDDGQSESGKKKMML